MGRFNVTTDKKDLDTELAERCLLEESAEFRAFVEQMPDKHWAKYDLSAVRLGWEAARLRQQSEDSARLDWFQACGWVWRMVPTYQDQGDGAYELEWTGADGYSHTVRDDLLRSAIDKARES